MRAALFIMILSCVSLKAQVQPFVSVRLQVADADVSDGRYAVRIAWYGSPSGGAPSAVEDLIADVEGGWCTVTLGLQSPLPESLLSSGRAFVGTSLNGTAERVPRTALVPVPYAQRAAVSEMAAGLLPEVTGIVTSINEIAGAVKLVADSGARIRRSGETIHIGLSGAAVASGTIAGNGRDHSFTLPTSPGMAQYITAAVISPSGTCISVSAQPNADKTAITFTTSAVLTSEEFIVWTQR